MFRNRNMSSRGLGQREIEAKGERFHATLSFPKLTQVFSITAWKHGKCFLFLLFPYSYTVVCYTMS